MPGAVSEYIGRFAPTPSGPLHLGSIITALASFLDARSKNGKWLLRIDDLDTPRIRPGAIDSIFSTLESLGLNWDGEVLYQSQRQTAYDAALHKLKDKGLIFPCRCSRQNTKGKVYPGTCRKRAFSDEGQQSIRIIARQQEVTLKDLVQDNFAQDLERDVGDFVVKRADGIIAYHLAVVVDDAYQNITHMVRGADLMDSCPRQIYLQNILELKTPEYAHIPLAVYDNGEKLSKRYEADHALLDNTPEKVIFHALEFLGQQPPAELFEAGLEDLMAWGTGNWDLQKVPAQRQSLPPIQFQNRKRTGK